MHWPDASGGPAIFLPPTRCLNCLRLPPELNPCAGPIVVEGARRGDLLAVRIERIEVADQGVTCFVPGVGPLHDSYRSSEYQGAVHSHPSP